MIVQHMNCTVNRMLCYSIARFDDRTMKFPLLFYFPFSGESPINHQRLLSPRLLKFRSVRLINIILVTKE